MTGWHFLFKNSELFFFVLSARVYTVQVRNNISSGSGSGSQRMFERTARLLLFLIIKKLFIL